MSGMNHILLIAFDDEFDQLIRIINKEKTVIKHIASAQTKRLLEILKDRSMSCEVSSYENLPEIVQERHFDYIVISDTWKIAGKKNRLMEELERLKVDHRTIVNMTNVCSQEYFPLYNILRNYAVFPQSYRFFVTGVSHAFAGTDIECFSMPGMNLAFTSQDLFLDYELAKKIVRKGGTLKYAILGIAPFSLHYDMSQSVNVGRMMMYYPIIRKLHHCPITDEKLKELFSGAYFDSFDTFLPELVYRQRLGCNSMDEQIRMDDFLGSRSNLAFWDEKSYPDTVAENVQILNDYIALCLQENIMPLLVIYPVTEWYNRYFSPKKFDELRTVLSDLSAKYRIPFLDHAADECFSLSDFFDVEHLNIHGAKKFSAILNEHLLAMDQGAVPK